jgi:hypothetical protein
VCHGCRILPQWFASRTSRTSKSLILPYWSSVTNPTLPDLPVHSLFRDALRLLQVNYMWCDPQAGCLALWTWRTHDRRYNLVPNGIQCIYPFMSGTWPNGSIYNFIRASIEWFSIQTVLIISKHNFPSETKLSIISKFQPTGQRAPGSKGDPSFKSGWCFLLLSSSVSKGDPSSKSGWCFLLLSSSGQISVGRLKRTHTHSPATLSSSSRENAAAHQENLSPFALRGNY